MQLELRKDRAASVIAAARTWIGTPYHHQASMKGVGADCLGLVRGVYREVMDCEPEIPPPYTRDWGEVVSGEPLLSAAARHLTPIAVAHISPADVLVFRLRSGMAAKHCAILVSPQTMVHAMEGTAASEVVFCSWWRRHLAGAFRFPE